MSASWPPRLMFNSDGNWVNNYQERHDPSDLTRMIGPLRDAGVDLLSVLIGIDDDLSWRGSPHGQLWCDNVTEWDVDGVPTDIHGNPITDGAVHIHGRATANRQATNAHEELFNTIAGVIEDGHDLMQIYVDGAREHGLPVFASMRMNDAHTDSEDRMWYGRSTLKIERPDLLIGSALPEARHGAEWTFSWMWDYAQDEVRQRFLGIADETLTRYDFDGLEFDFCRQPPYFRGGEVVQNIPVMTDFVRQGRDVVRRHAQRRGRDVRFVVRVPTSIGESLSIGIDTLAWIREGLADAFVISSPGYCVTRADVAAAVEAAGGAGAGSTVGSTAAPTRSRRRRATSATPRRCCAGAGLNGYRDGAAGIALFNYDYGTPPGRPGAGRLPRPDRRPPADHPRPARAGCAGTARPLLLPGRPGGAVRLGRPPAGAAAQAGAARARCRRRSRPARDDRRRPRRGARRRPRPADGAAAAPHRPRGSRRNACTWRSTAGASPSSRTAPSPTVPATSGWCSTIPACRPAATPCS